MSISRSALREPDEAERLAARDQAPEDPPLTRRVRVLALDALVPIVSRDNPVPALAMSDLARLFSGEIDNWAALGGPDAPVALHLLASGLGPAQDFANPRPWHGPALAPGIVRHESAAELANAVAHDAFAVGISRPARPGRRTRFP
jgi:phosphate transport system substrate-binding protein